MQRKLILLIGVLLVAGCAANSESPSPAASTPLSETSSTSTPSASSEEDQIEDYAIALLDLKNDLEDQMNDWDDSNCSGIAATYREDVLCRIQVVTMKSLGSIAAGSTSRLTQLDHPDYIGVPPETIKDYLENIVALGEDVEKDGEKFTNDDCGDNDDCAHVIDSIVVSLQSIIREIEKIELRA